MSHLSPEARDLLARAHHADVPAPDDRERNRRALQIGAGVLLPAGGAIAQGWLATALPRALAVLALASVAGVAITRPPPPPAPPPAHAAPRRVAPAAPRSLPSATPPPPPAAPRPTLAVAAPTAPTAPAPSVRRVSPRLASTELARVVAPLPVAPAPIVAAPIVAAPAAPPPPRDASLAEQLRLLAEAQAALRANDPARARALAAECRQRYPHGALATEVDAVSLLASCAAGVPSREAAARWLAEAPRSPLAGRVRRACGLDAP